MALSPDQAGSDGQMTTLGPAGVTLVTGRVLRPQVGPLSLHQKSVVRAGGRAFSCTRQSRP